MEEKLDSLAQQGTEEMLDMQLGTFARSAEK